MTEAYSKLISDFDADGGYPTDTWLEKFDALERTAFDHHDAAIFLTRDIVPITNAISCVHVGIEDGKDGRFGDAPVKLVEYHTGGWSGAEDLIESMLRQFWIRHYHTRWERGGHFYFEVPVRMLPDVPR